MANLTQLSKFLALILRHKAEEFDVQLDKNGFADVDLVWQIIANKYGDKFNFSDLETVVSGDKHRKKRYEIVDDKIRAMFGHSAVSEIEYPLATPPQVLYHGTTQEAIASIKVAGLESRNRQYVHLTTNLENAKRVATRHSQVTIILKVKALVAYHDGIQFHQPADEHFLCKYIPSQYIDFDS